MIEIALQQYLTAPRDLKSPSDTQRFARPIMFGDATIETRNDARRWLRDQIGSRIYAGRNLKSEGNLALTFRRISGSQDTHLRGDDRTVAIVQADIWANGRNAFIRANYASECLRVAIVHYRGHWGRTEKAYVASVTVQRQAQQMDSPNAGEQYWDFRFSADYQINYLANQVEV